MLPTSFAPKPNDAPQSAPEAGIDGYVLDNMEGAVDQASFLAKLDIPIAIIGPHGTGKMYVAKVVHQESGREPGLIVQIDCRAFRNRNDAIRRIQRELKQSEGKTLVFKSPHLMSADAQLKLARQIASRTLADVSPPRYLPDVKLVALFPDTLEQLIMYGSLTEKLASVFAGFPIYVPPIKDRGQAVLRWAHKILGQECLRRDQDIKGFTEEAEQGMLGHEWSGNISEIRQRICQAMVAASLAEREWITPVDLGVYKDTDTIEATTPIPTLFLEAGDKIPVSEESYAPPSIERLDVALGEAVSATIRASHIDPLGSWLQDDLVLAARERYSGSLRSTADLLRTNPRNISRWLPQIEQRAQQRNGSPIWSEPRRLAGEWIRESSLSSESPLELARNMLLSHLTTLEGSVRVSTKAAIMGMSIPTYNKAVKEHHG